MVEEYCSLGTGKYVVNLWNGGGMLLQNSGRFLPDHTASYAKRPWSITRGVLTHSGLMEIFSLYVKFKKKCGLVLLTMQRIERCLRHYTEMSLWWLMW
jgi:hypothetical protein